MNFNEFINEVHAYVEDEKVTKSTVKDIVESIVEVVREQIIENQENVQIPNLGIFKYNVRNARKARNPKTGESVDVPAKATVTFKLAKSFKDELSKIEIN